MMLVDGNGNNENDDNDDNAQDATVVERSREHGQASGNQEWAATGKVEFYDGRDDDGLDDHHHHHHNDQYYDDEDN